MSAISQVPSSPFLSCSAPLPLLHGWKWGMKTQGNQEQAQDSPLLTVWPLSMDIWPGRLEGEAPDLAALCYFQSKQDHDFPLLALDHCLTWMTCPSSKYLLLPSGPPLPLPTSSP